MQHLAVALAALVWAVSSSAVAQFSLPPSPCPEYYTYKTEYGETVGLITFLTPARYSQVSIVVRLSSPVSVRREELGELAINGGLAAAQEATNDVVAGRRHILQYRLRFPHGKPVPTLLSLNINDYEICTGPSVPSNRVTITQQAHLNVGVHSAPDVNGREFQPVGSNGFKPESPDFSSPNLPPVHPEIPESWYTTAHVPRPETTTRPTPPPPPPPPPVILPEAENGNKLVDPSSCGVPAERPNTLVIHGLQTTKGQWPWQAAIFKNNKSSSINLQFHCGGTLVSRFHIITACHCVNEAKDIRKIQLTAISDLLVCVGKFNIFSWTEAEQQLRGVKEIIIHPQYNPENYRNDIAILELSSKVEFTDFVKPICLWDRSPELFPHDQSYVGGWGYDETGSLSDTMRIAIMPIVSQETCLRSGHTFYVKYTSNTTLCAGYRNGTTVCNGDSGGGLHIRLENSHQSGRKTWYLRGIVSLSMRDVGEVASCDTMNYVVFTDVAKYMVWIKQQISY